jgi:hypothetical protein
VQIDLETKLDVQRELNVFKYNPDFEAAQLEWAAIRKEILGEDSEQEGSDDDDDGESEDDAEDNDALPGPPNGSKPTQVLLSQQQTLDCAAVCTHQLLCNAGIFVFGQHNTCHCDVPALLPWR